MTSRKPVHDGASGRGPGAAPATPAPAGRPAGWQPTWAGAAVAWGLALVFSGCAPLPAAAPAHRPAGDGAPLAAAPAVHAGSVAARPQPVAAASIATQPQPVAAATAHPLATQAALQVLAEGGSALDATITAQLVLGLVEPQSSGLGGGALLLVWDDAARRLHGYDGLAAAPANSTSALRVDVDGRLLPAQAVARSGRSVGVPGLLPVLALAHARHGRLPWARLVQPALALARQGFAVSPYVHGILARDPGAREHPEFRADWFDAQGRVHPVGTVMHNAAYARTLDELATHGPAGYLQRGGAQRVADATRRGSLTGLMTADDVLAYRPAERTPLCATVRGWRVCAAAPPSFGGVAVLQTLQMLDRHLPVPLDAAALDDAAFWHLFAEAGRLAQADRRHWVGDPDHVAVPAATLVDPAYTRQRAALIDPARAAPRVGHGTPALPAVSQGVDHAGAVAADTSQIVVADAEGQVVSTTTTINLNFGARLRVDGYVLNNALTNFGPAPERGQVLANQMAPGKRPVTSMAPLIVFDPQGRPVLAGGSAGGGPIVDVISRNLLEMLWLGRTPAQALAGGHVSTALAPRVQLEAGTPRAALAAGLRARGHEVVVEPLNSGAAFLQRVDGGWLGAADPRRDGVALGMAVGGALPAPHRLPSPAR